MKIYPEKIILKWLKEIVKNIGLSYRAKPHLSETSLKTKYFSYIHSYLNYANLAWANTFITNIKELPHKQKQEVCLGHSEPLFKILNALNVYKINWY